MDSRDIPDSIKREVRKRCGFGCVICGKPIYDYDHLKGWANRRRHIAREITLLCPDHHREKTNGLLPYQMVQAANLEPHNRRLGVSKEYELHFLGSEFCVEIGSNKVLSRITWNNRSIIPLVIDDIPIIQFDIMDDHVLFSMTWRNQFNEIVFLIDKNQLVFSPENWDVEFVGKKIIIRTGMRNILLDIEFEAPGKVSINRGILQCNGVQLIITPDSILIANDGSEISLIEVQGLHGFLIGVCSDLPSGCMRIPRVPRFMSTDAESTNIPDGS